jgi:hypothetical protein
MTSPITLPETKGVKTDKIHMIDYAGQLKPQLGGVVQTLNRLGTRHALEVTLPTMKAEPWGRIWATQLRLAKMYGAIIWFRQDGLTIGNCGTNIQVNGAGQTGSTLALKNFTAGYTVLQGQAFSIVSGGRRYLHFAAADTTATAGGLISLPIFPMLRVIPADTNLCEFTKPYIQGSLSGNEVSWERLPMNYFNFGTIVISEDA